MPTRSRVDLSALYEGIQDELVNCNVLSEDNYTIVASHDGSGVFYDKDNPRMEITITAKPELVGIPIKKRPEIIVDKEAF